MVCPLLLGSRTYYYFLFLDTQKKEELNVPLFKITGTYSSTIKYNLISITYHQLPHLRNICFSYILSTGTEGSDPNTHNLPLRF